MCLHLNQEESMAKGQARSNKEVRKPKKDKAAPVAAPATLGAKAVESSKQKKP